jgi:glutamine synthetase
VASRLAKGESLEAIIASLTEETRAIRFEGNGYSEEWKVEARQRGLYVNEVFSEIYSLMEKEQAVFENLKICSSEETRSRAKVASNNYKETVNIEQSTLLLIADKHILPRAYEHLHRIRGDFHSSILDREFTTFKASLEELISEVNLLRNQ